MSSVEPTTTDPAVVLEGEIDMAVADDVLTQILEAADQGTTTVDLSGVTFIDSSGIHAIFAAAGRLNGNGPLHLRAPSPAVRRLLSITAPSGVPGIELDDAS